MHVPAVSIKDYLFRYVNFKTKYFPYTDYRISNYAKCSADCYVLALVYIDRVIRGNANFAVNSLNAHRLVIVAMMVAAKYHDDHYFNNDYYAVIGGVTNEEINTLEVEFLFMINFNLFVAVESFRQYERELLNHGQQCWQCASTLLATLPQGTIQTQE